LKALEEYYSKIKRGIAVRKGTSDVDSREILAADASWQRSSTDAEYILKKALRLCLNNLLILVDEGPWYGEALEPLAILDAHHSRRKKPNRKMVQNPERKDETLLQQLTIEEKRREMHIILPRNRLIQQPKNTPNPKKRPPIHPVILTASLVQIQKFK